MCQRSFSRPMPDPSRDSVPRGSVQRQSEPPAKAPAAARQAEEPTAICSGQRRAFVVTPRPCGRETTPLAGQSQAGGTNGPRPAMRRSVASHRGHLYDAERQPKLENAEMNPLATTDELFFTQSGLDRGRVEHLTEEALNGADDGEMYLEYSQSEALSFDDGKLKSASFDTTQGFGLRAVKGEAAGYAHASELSEEAMRRAATTVKAVHGGRGGKLAACARRHQPPALCRGQPHRRGRFRGQDQAPGRDRRLCPGQGSPRAPGHGLARAAAGRRSRSCAARAIAPPTSARWCASTSAWWWRRTAAWRPAAMAPAGAPAMTSISSRKPGGRRPTRRCARPWSISAPSRHRRVRWRSCSGRAGRASCCMRPSAMGWRAISTARRPAPSPGCSASASPPKA